MDKWHIPAQSRFVKPQQSQTTPTPLECALLLRNNNMSAQRVSWDVRVGRWEGRDPPMRCDRNWGMDGANLR